jgi:hypothetical protein
MVESGDDDLVVGPQLAADRPSEAEVEVGRARTEDRLSRCAAEEAGRSRTCLLDQLVRAAASLERAAAVRVRLAQVPRDRLYHLVRHLRPGGSVEERVRAPQRREAAANRLDVE